MTQPTNLAADAVGWLVLAGGAIGLGLGGLLARRPASAGWRGTLAAGLLALAGGAAAGGLGSSVVLSLLILAGWQTVQMISGLAAARRAGARLGGLLLSPRLHAVLLLAGGAAVASWQVVRIDREAEADLRQTDSFLSILSEAPDLSPVADRLAVTDRGRPVPLFAANASDSISASVERDHLRGLGLDLNVMQTGRVDVQYNCHGWVFTGGKYWVRGAAVSQILEENGYGVIQAPAPGDLAVFRDGKGEVSHTALVRAVTADGTVLLESKWGQLGRYLHNDTQHAYRAGSCTYYRSPRAGHLLRGLDYAQQRVAASGT